MSGPSPADKATYGWPKLVRDVEGMHAKTTREMQTAMMVIPAGTRVRITRSFAWHRLEITADPCSCCGVSVRVSRVNWRHLMPCV